MKDLYKIVRESRFQSRNKGYQSINMTIVELHGLGKIVFSTPLQVCATIPDDIDEPVRYNYDFGMACKVSVKPGHNFLYDYAGENESFDPIKTLFSTIKFDLMHAFFHIEIDPNYTSMHWALAGNLRNRVTTSCYEDDGLDYNTVTQLEFDFS